MSERDWEETHCEMIRKIGLETEDSHAAGSFQNLVDVRVARVTVTRLVMMGQLHSTAVLFVSNSP